MTTITTGYFRQDIEYKIVISLDNDTEYFVADYDNGEEIVDARFDSLDEAYKAYPKVKDRTLEIINDGLAKKVFLILRQEIFSVIQDDDCNQQWFTTNVDFKKEIISKGELE